MLEELDQRSQDILRHIVDAFLETGEPVGSKTLSAKTGLSLSPATIRNVMASLEHTGLLFAPHTSAGRLPTDKGLRLFVDGLLEFGDLTREEEKIIEAQCVAKGRNFRQVLEQATQELAGLSQCAGLVLAPKDESAVKHIEFVYLEPGKALVVLVLSNGQVENRIVEIPAGLPVSSLVQAANFLNARLAGQSLSEAGVAIEEELKVHQAQLDELTQKVVEKGLAVWSGSQEGQGTLIMRGQSRLLNQVEAMADLHTIQALFEALEARETVFKLLQATESAGGVQIYIGAENQLFGVAGCSMVISPFKDAKQKIVGAIGVIGPTRLNYARIVPMVDYTSKVITKMIS